MAPKKKVEKMSLGDFLGDQSLGSWADEMEDMPVASMPSRSGYGEERRAFSSAPSFGMGGADRGGDRGFPPRQQLPLPTKPPYTAHLGNLPFDATSLDIEEFFAQCEVSNVRIVEDRMDHKPKGFGYVEFRSLDGLKRALELSGTPFMNRDIRISVADPPKDRGETRELTDWTRKGPLPDLPQQQQRRASERGGFGTGSNYGAPPMERGGSRRGGDFEGDGKVRDFGNWERKGPLSPPPNAGPPQGMREGRPRNNETRERRNSPAWGEGRSQDGSRPPRRDARPQVERVPTAAEKDNQWRARMRPDAAVKSGSPTPEPSQPSSPAQPPAPATRPKLNLAKRTVSEAQPSPSSAGFDSKASPFGAARPIDTSAREKEAMEKRELAIREKREADEKAREEKKAAEAAKAEAAEGEEKANGKKENGDAPRPGFKILARDAEGDAEAQDADANGDIVEDKAVKPKEFAREPPKGPKADRRPAPGGDRDWRRKSSTPNTPTSPKNAGATAEKLEDDGWSTVPTKQRGGKGRGGARAIAS